MMGILGKIFGSDKAIAKGFDLVDDLWTSKEETIHARAKAKSEIMSAYAPFKVSQRIIAWAVTGVVLLCFVTAFGITIWDFFTAGQITNAKGEDIVDVLTQLLDSFKLGWAFTLIILFYFGGGMAEGITERYQLSKGRREAEREPPSSGGTSPTRSGSPGGVPPGGGP